MKKVDFNKLQAGDLVEVPRTQFYGRFHTGTEDFPRRCTSRRLRRI